MFGTSEGLLSSLLISIILLKYFYYEFYKNFRERYFLNETLKKVKNENSCEVFLGKNRSFYLLIRRKLKSFNNPENIRNSHFLKYKKFFQSGFFRFSSSESYFLKYKRNIRKFRFLKYKEFFSGFLFPEIEEQLPFEKIYEVFSGFPFPETVF